MQGRYDAIIIGAGHNGLVTACYLAKAGKKVLVLERRDVLGGACVTEETFPGFKVSTCAYVNSLFRKEITDELKLKDHGFELLERSPSSFSPFHDGRYLMMGFASDKTKVDEPFIVPRRVATGNFKLCGVLLSYAAPEMAAMMKQAVGFNFATRDLGQKINDSIIELVREQAIRPVIGQVLPFEEIPAAITAMANRETIGRVIITP